MIDTCHEINSDRHETNSILQRVSIARALYSDADIILLDDPLSAVDSHVGKHLFEKAIKQYWKEKIVILATNQLQYLPYADKVLFLNNGEVAGEGTFQELLQSSTVFAEQMLKYGVGGEKQAEEKKDAAVVKEVEKAGEPEHSKYHTISQRHCLTFPRRWYIGEHRRQTNGLDRMECLLVLLQARRCCYFCVRYCLLVDRCDVTCHGCLVALSMD